MGIPEIRAARLLSEVCAELGVKNRKELRAKYDQEEWEDALGHITRFIERNGHSGVPADY